MDFESIAKDLGLTDETVQNTVESITTEPKVDSGKPAKVKEVTVSYKITPKGSYSTVEVSETVEVRTEDRKLVDGIIAQLRHEVLRETSKAAEQMLQEMTNKNLI